MHAILRIVSFHLIDDVRELTADRIVAAHVVRPETEYLQDHFPTFPVLPGVMMLEAMAQAARRLLQERDPAAGRVVLSGVRALKYGGMVRPGETLVVDVSVHKAGDAGEYDFKGVGSVLSDGGESRTAVSGRFTMRPVTLTAMPTG